MLNAKTALFEFAVVFKTPRDANPVVTVERPLLAFNAVPEKALISLLVVLVEIQLLDPLLPFR
jgi:hypothetical protein